MSEQNRYIALGTAGERPTRMRGQAGALLHVGEQLWLIDPGEGALRAIELMDVSLRRLTHILITHLGLDCCIGLPSILEALGPDTQDIQIFYPGADEEYFRMLLNCSRTRQTDPVCHPLHGTCGTLDLAGNVRVTYAALDHDRPCYGLAFHLEGKALVALVSDTSPCDAAVGLANGARLCVCRTAYLERHQQRARERKLMTALDAAALARSSGCGVLLMTGFARNYELPNGFVHEARAIFPACDFAQDLTEYPVEFEAVLT